MKNWRRSSRLSTTSSGTTSAVHVVSVVDQGGGITQWTFDAVITGDTQSDGLQVDGNNPTIDDGFAGAVLTLEYGGPTTGLAWSTDLPNVVLTFAGGGVLASGSGTVT